MQPKTTTLFKVKQPTIIYFLLTALLCFAIFTMPAAAEEGSAATKDAHSTNTHTPMHQGDVDAAKQEREIALASAWVLDPKLVTITDDDSQRTRQARRALTRQEPELRRVLDEYQQAASASQEANLALEAAKNKLAAAQVTAAQAEASLLRSQAALATLVRGQYTSAEVSQYTLLLDEQAEEILANLSLAELIDSRQATAVAQADQAAQDLDAALVQVTKTEQEAYDSAQDAAALLTQAATSRAQAVEEITQIKKSLEVALAADQARIAEEQRLAAAAVVGDGIYIKPNGPVSFPLPPNVFFVDNNNFGGSGKLWSNWHTGNDLSTSCGTPVLAATNGRVTIRTDQGWAGPWLVMVGNPNGVSTWYAHMQAVLVQDGQWVKAGQQIGEVGTEGNSTGCHLHFEYHPTSGSIYEDATDPYTWWKTLGVYPGQSLDSGKPSE